MMIFSPYLCVMCLSRSLSGRFSYKDRCHTNNILLKYRWGYLIVQDMCYILMTSVMTSPGKRMSHIFKLLIIGIDHDTVCAGVVGTAIRNSTSCAGRRAAACGRHNECCSGLQYQPLQRRPYRGQFLFYHDHNLQKVRETCVFDVLYRCSSPSAFA